uniref:(California timema) hypothetical protein n=1 Tax=Timema californicum TaxID=61474 RepID=A0A7R9P3S4_TIMCA|nr:unnamed protein product [Timema californicum]
MCEASAHPPPHYQWFRDNTPLSGQNNYRLTIQGVTQSDQGEYKCSVENEAGEVFSRLSELVIYEEPEDGDNDTYRYTASEKVALLIGNDVYENMGRLNTPSNDVISVATILHQIGFKVIALHNLTLTEMRNAIKEFCNLLSRGVYGVFYFVGHGFEISGDKFMLPVDAPDPTRYLRRDSLCERELIYKAQKNNPQLLLVLLDMCLKTPDQESNPIIHREKALMYPWVPRRNLLIGYATTNTLSAYEVDAEENGVYATHLQRHLADDLPVEEVMKRVRSCEAGSYLRVSPALTPFWPGSTKINCYSREAIESENSSASKQQIPCAFVTVARRFRLTDPIRENFIFTREVFIHTSQVGITEDNILFSLLLLPEEDVIIVYRGYRLTRHQQQFSTHPIHQKGRGLVQQQQQSRHGTTLLYALHKTLDGNGSGVRGHPQPRGYVGLNCAVEEWDLVIGYW